MKGEWKVTSNYINGTKMYAIYRILNTSEVDHSGNREYASDYMQSKVFAETIARGLNQEEAEKNQKKQLKK